MVSGDGPWEGCELHRLAFERRWEEMEERVRSHPEEALHVINGHLTALITALKTPPQRPPLNVITTYLEVAPDAASMYTRDGIPPLAFACYAGCDPNIVVALAAAHPDAVLYQNSRGCNVFHHCCQLWILGKWSDSEGTPIEEILSVVEDNVANQALLSLDNLGRAPIHMACERENRIPDSEFRVLANATRTRDLTLSPIISLNTSHRDLLRAGLNTRNLTRQVISTEDPSPHCNEARSVSVRHLWTWRPQDNIFLWKCLKKARVLLGVEEHESSICTPLHSCIEMDSLCETLFFDCLLRINPFYACQSRSSDGSLPIHLVARHAREASDAILAEKWTERIQTLLSLYPKGMNIQDSEGRLPLELLAQPRGRASWEQVRMLLEMSPSAVSRLEFAEPMYSYLLARLNREQSTDMIFRILCETPTLIEKRR
jgi:hypothetical protein